MAETTNIKVQEYIQLHEQAISIFSRDYESGYENARIRRSQHFDATDTARILSNGRLPYSIPVAEPKFNAMISNYIFSKTDWKIIGRGLEDELDAEKRTVLMRYIEDINDWIYTETDCYADALTKKYGSVEVSIEDSDNPLGDVILTKLQFDQVLWDRNCKDFNLSKKANWMQKFMYISKEDLLDMYPEKKEFIESVGAGNYDNSESNKDKPYYSWMIGKGEKLLYKVVWHYQRKKVAKYQHYFESGMEENDNPDFTKDISLKNDGATITEQLKPSYSDKKYDEYIEVTCFIKDSSDALEVKKIDSKYIPIHNLFVNYDDGFFWSVTDMVKSPIIWIDRISMQIDFSLNVLLKNSYEIDWDNLHQDDQNRWIQIDNDGNDIGLGRQLVQGGAVIRRRGKDKILDAIQSTQVPPDLYNVWQMMVKIIDDAMGSKSSMGIKQSDNESGVLVKQRAELALAAAQIYMHNLERWKKTLGENIMEYSDKVYSEEIQLRIQGEDLSEQFLKALRSEGSLKESELNKGRMFMNYKSNPETKYDLVVSKSAHSETVKEKKFQMLLAYNQSKINAGERPLPMSIIGKTIDIDATLLAEITQWESEQDAIMQKQQEIMGAEKLVQGNLAQAKETREGMQAMNAQRNSLTAGPETNGVAK